MSEIGIPPEIFDELVQRIYRDMVGHRPSVLRLWNKEMRFKSELGAGAICGCCLDQVIGFCLEHNPKAGDRVSCSKKCLKFGGGTMTFDGKTWIRTDPKKEASG